MKWPADQVERWPVARLVPSARNARTHSAAQVDQIAASIREWGWTTPALIDEKGNVIAGHGRILAARKLGITEIPVVIAVDWTDAQKRAYAIADNKLALNAEWDADLLKIEIEGLKNIDFDVGLLGFGQDELDTILNPGSDQIGHGSLADKFMIPPFSVLNAREGWWQNRKRLWLGIGIQSELGRGENALGMSESTDAYRYHKQDYSEAERGKAHKDQHKLTALQKGKRKPNAETGGSKRPAANYGKTRARGDGRGRAIAT